MLGLGREPEPQAPEGEYRALLRIPNGFPCRSPGSRKRKVRSTELRHLARSGGPPGSRREELSQLSLIRDIYIRFQVLIHEVAKFGVVGAVGFVVQLTVQNVLHSGFDVGALTAV